MNEKVVLDEDDVRRTLVRIAHEIVEKNADRPIALVGIHRRGAHLARRLHRLVCDLLEADVPLGDLADRGHRELPIRPDYVGKNLPTARNERVNVRVSELDGSDEVTITELQ